MRLRPVLLVAVICAAAPYPCCARPPELTAKPNPASPGQTVTLVWHFVGEKIVLYGGRFGQGTNVTARKSATAF